MHDEDVLDVLVVGAGLAGLSLARHLLLETDKTVLVVDRREVPPVRQKVGEATVQLSGYYFARVLDLEEHLLREHYLKYNLRFYWPTERGGARCEDYGQSYIRQLSNIATYQLDRNLLEAELLRCIREDPRCRVVAPVPDLEVDLSPEGPPHAFRFRTAEGEEVASRAAWVVDASGRGRFLSRRLATSRPSPIRHGTSFLWVEGKLDPERLTDLSSREIRRRPDRSVLGHLPTFLATNHFCGEGWWLWVIPLHGKTSLGLVYEQGAVPRKEVSTPEGLIRWICRELPLFARDLPGRRVLHHAGFADFALDSGETINAAGWAFTGEACRFSDPLYSPGGDLIAVHNTLIVDAVRTAGRSELEKKVRYSEALARGLYEAYLPGYTVGYAVLGDQETFSLRYAWELTIYFAFYVFPFVNDLFTEPSFLPGFLRRFSRLGPWNHGLMAFLSGYYRWKKEHLGLASPEPVFFDFTEVGALRAAETCFYKVGLGSEEARRVLDEQLRNLRELARWTVAHLSSVVVGDPEAASNAAFVAGIDPDALPPFDAEEIRRRWRECASPGRHPGRHEWPFEVPCMKRFHRRPAPVAAAGGAV